MLGKLTDNRGIALFTTLTLMILSFAVVVTLFYLVTYGTRLSGQEGRYTAALESAKGGVEFMISMIRESMTTPPGTISQLNAAGPSGADCLRKKLENYTSSTTWSCGQTLADLTNPNPTVLPDLTLSLGGYSVFVKIVDTRESSSQFFYTINARAQAQSSNDYAEVSLLYRLEK